LLTAAATGYTLARRLGAGLPEIGWRRAVGGLLLLVVVLAALQALAGAFGIGELARADEAGGGYVGGLILGGLVAAVGEAGSAVILLMLALAGVALLAGLSPSEVFAESGRRAEHLASRLRRERRPDRGAGRVEPMRPVAPGPSTPIGARSGLPAAPRAPLDSMPRVGAPSTETGSSWEAPSPPPGPAWAVPSLESILDRGTEMRPDDQFDRQRGRLIEDTQMAFGAPVRIVEINRGPTITQFGVEPDYTEGRGGRRTKVKVSKITALADDLALALAAPSVRIQAPVPGKGFVGIEVPNAEIQLVALRDVMEAAPFSKMESRLRLGLGQDVSGRAVAADLAAMPHLLIAGTTGSGKSVCVTPSSPACSCKTRRTTCAVMVDPKRLVGAVQPRHLLHRWWWSWIVVGAAVGFAEMNERYNRFSQAGCACRGIQPSPSSRRAEAAAWCWSSTAG
jgi:S-DNA-T family DNA segregation ATPase FtsK/SpoIIIE